MWGQRSAAHRLLNEIADSGATITRSPWRWGCHRNLPDFVLVSIGVRRRMPGRRGRFSAPTASLNCPGICAGLAQQTGRHIPFILVTPYRPLEY